jgi:DNA polymerase III alpha subunit (gram-positive type)
MSLIFDLEADGLLKQATKVHCIALCDTETGDVWSYGPNEIEKGLDELYSADSIAAHNGTTYDLPLLRKLYGWNRRPGQRLIDTLVVARLLYPNIKNEDYARVDFEPKLIGSHSLRAWGHSIR